MDYPKIRGVVPTEEIERAVSVQVSAFIADPVMRWLWPDPDEYLCHYRTFTRAFGGRAFEHDTAHVSDGFLGGSMWLPPGVAVDGDAVEACFSETVPEPRRSQMFEILEQMDEVHPEEPHWYLAIIGVDPAKQGQGVGSALMRHALEGVDAAGLPAYLESSNPANISLYRRHGFEVIREIRVGEVPVVTPMLRPAR